MDLVRAQPGEVGILNPLQHPAAGGKSMLARTATSIDERSMSKLFESLLVGVEKTSKVRECAATWPCLERLSIYHATYDPVTRETDEPHVRCRADLSEEEEEEEEPGEVDRQASGSRSQSTAAEQTGSKKSIEGEFQS